LNNYSNQKIKDETEEVNKSKKNKALTVTGHEGL
jgi:hypothetical protein